MILSLPVSQGADLAHRAQQSRFYCREERRENKKPFHSLRSLRSVRLTSSADLHHRVHRVKELGLALPVSSVRFVVIAVLCTRGLPAHV